VVTEEAAISVFRYFRVWGLEQQVILESLHRERLVHGTPKGFGLFDPNHRDSLDLMCEFPFQEFRDSDIGEWKDRE
jgi:hypothetical protein